MVKKSTDRISIYTKFIHKDSRVVSCANYDMPYNASLSVEDLKQECLNRTNKSFSTNTAIVDFIRVTSNKKSKLLYHRK